jgi:hypothetical protein
LGLTQTYGKTGQLSNPPNLPYPATPKVGPHHYICHHYHRKRRANPLQRQILWANLDKYNSQHSQLWKPRLLSNLDEMLFIVFSTSGWGPMVEILTEMDTLAGLLYN